MDPSTGDIIPTRGRAKKNESKTSAPAVITKTGPKPFAEIRHLYYGATYLFDKLADDLGLTADLKQCFPDNYKKLLSIHLYSMKDIVEKAFGNIKERLNMRRLLVSSEKGLDGKIFTEFVALILISHLDHKMKETGLYSNYTMQQLLDKLDVLECFEDANHSLRIGEMLNKQAEIYKALGVAAPTSSC